MKRWLIIVIIITCIILGWRLSRASSDNLLVNSDFSQPNGEGWLTSSRAGAQTQFISSSDGFRLELSIPGSSENSLALVGQKVAVSSQQSYQAILKYRLTKRIKKEQQFILRLSQYDKNQALIAEEDIVDSHWRMMRPSAEWQLLAHTFEMSAEVTTLDLGVGLYGGDTATIELETFILQPFPKPTWVNRIQQDPLNVLLVGLLLMALGYSIYSMSPLKLAATEPIRGRFTPRWGAIIIVNLLLFCLFAELAALGIYVVKTGTLFYTNPPIYQTVGDTENKELTSMRFHPYLGFILKPAAAGEVSIKFLDDMSPNDKLTVLRSNNYGFSSNYRYPFIKEHDQQYIIGIFGGSVAAGFSALGADTLINHLKQHPFFHDKEIIILNFAQGAYKQPQQLQTLTYFLSLGQTFDLVINIDGFNEIALSTENNEAYKVDISMPSAPIIMPLVNLVDQNTLTPEKLVALSNLNYQKSQVRRLSQILNQNRLATVDFVLGQYYQYVYNRYQQATVDFKELDTTASKNSLIYLNPAEPAQDRQLLYADIAENWLKSSILMAKLLKTENSRYFHFLQPNQYDSHHTFSEAEANIAFLDKSPYKPSVEEGYPVLITHGAELTRQGVKFFNSVAIFDEVPQPLYVDNCCHFNKLGNEILAEFVAQSILSVW